MRTVIPKNAKLIPEQAKRVFKGNIFDVYQWDQEMFDGSFEVFEMLKRPDTTKIFCIKDDKIIFVEEEQPGHKFFDVPGGRHDIEGETELQSAQREVKEETGMFFKNWKLIEVTQPQSKIDWLVYVYVAWDLEKTIAPEVHPGERIILKELNFEEAVELSKDPKLRHSFEDILQKAGSVQGLIDFPEFKV